jgi:transketolase
LGEEEVRLTKRNYGWPEDAKFLVPEGVKEHFREGIGKRGRELHSQWVKLYNEYAKQYPQLAEQLTLMQHRELPAGWDKNLPSFRADPKGMGTRESSGKVLNAVAQNIPWMIGGSADLGNSNKTALKFEGAGNFDRPSYGGRNIFFGVREHAMGAALNGMSVSKLRPFGGTFFNFSDYLRPTIRLAALMETPVIYIFTHDSIGLGEDGPTHQPIEQLAALRAVPNIVVFRPGDANEVVETWRAAMQINHGPVLLVLTRQAVPTLDRTKYAPASGVAKGAYVLAGAEGGKPDVILMGTGSEVSLCVDAYEKLKAGSGLQRQCASPECVGAGLGRDGSNSGMGPLRRAQGANDRHALVRRICPVERSAETFWLHHGSSRERGQTGHRCGEIKSIHRSCHRVRGVRQRPAARRPHQSSSSWRSQ